MRGQVHHRARAINRQYFTQVVAIAARKKFRVGLTAVGLFSLRLTFDVAEYRPFIPVHKVQPRQKNYQETYIFELGRKKVTVYKRIQDT